MSRRPEKMDLSHDEYMAQRGQYVERGGAYRRSYYGSSGQWRVHQEQMHKMRQERLRRQRLEKEVEDLDRMQELCRKLKRKLRRDVLEMRHLHKRLLKKYLERMNELQIVEKQQQRRREFRQRFLATRRSHKKNTAANYLERNNKKLMSKNDGRKKPTDSDSESIEDTTNLLKPLNKHNHQLLVSLGIEDAKSQQSDDDDLSLRLSVEDPSMWKLPAYMEENQFLDDDELDD